MPSQVFSSKTGVWGCFAYCPIRNTLSPISCVFVCTAYVLKRSPGKDFTGAMRPQGRDSQIHDILGSPRRLLKCRFLNPFSPPEPDFIDMERSLGVCVCSKCPGNSAADKPWPCSVLDGEDYTCNIGNPCQVPRTVVHALS